MNHNPTPPDRPAADSRCTRVRDRGFTLVEVLVAIVLVGILSAVAVVGVNTLISSGNESACETSAESAKSASLAHLTTYGSYPTRFRDLTQGRNGNQALLELPDGASIQGNANNSRTVTGEGWTLQMNTFNNGNAPTFSCS